MTLGLKAGDIGLASGFRGCVTPCFIVEVTNAMANGDSLTYPAALGSTQPSAFNSSCSDLLASCRLSI